MAQLIYEVSFKGAASSTLAAAFDPGTLTVEHGVTTVRAELADQAELHGLIDRMYELRLELLEVHLVAEPSPSELGWIAGP